MGDELRKIAAEIRAEQGKLDAQTVLKCVHVVRAAVALKLIKDKLGAK